MLDELHNVIVRLRGRIEEHAPILSKSEAATRYTLVDPLLTALGWDLSDPNQVRVEYPTGNGFTDYTLFAGGEKPKALIEAKKLHLPLSEALSQAITYCNEVGIPRFVVTDGQKWAAYETFRPVPNPQKLEMEFSLADTSQATAIKTLWLWRGNFEAGNPIVPPKPPEAVSGDNHSQENEGVATASGGTQLSEFRASSSQQRPVWLVFPDQQRLSVQGSWFKMQAAVVEWLVQTGKLSAPDCPVLSKVFKVHMVHVEPKNTDGSSFRQPRQAAGLWIEGHQDSNKHVQRARDILAARGVDPATVIVLA